MIIPGEYVVGVNALAQPIDRAAAAFSVVKENEQVAPHIPASTVSISGHSLMMMRLFDSNRSDYEPPFISEFSERTYLKPCTLFLNKDDREIIADMYEYAQSEGADLTYVTCLASDLAWYRYGQDGKYKTPQSQTGHCTAEGRKLIHGFTEKDATTAERILNSDALRTTRLDQQYIRHKLDEEYGVLNHTHFDFLEKMVNKFSANGDTSPPLGSQFANYVDNGNEFVKHIEKDITIDIRRGRDPHEISLEPDSGHMKGFKSGTQETLKDILRGIIFNAIGPDSKNGLSTLVDFLMKNRR